MASKIHKDRGFGGRFDGFIPTTMLSLAVGFWTDLSSDDFFDQSTQAIIATDGLAFSEFSITNDHATDDIYVIWGEGGVHLTTFARVVKAGETYREENMRGINAGADVTTVSVQGSGALGDGRAWARFA